MPPVPRVRSRPSEAIIYVTAARLPKDEIREMSEMEGFDGSPFTGGDWRPDRMQTATVDLRFCNLEDGYIPLVKSVCSILSEDIGGKTIEMAWHVEQTSGFSCIVDEGERAIYNADGRLKTLFSNIPPGARLYIDRVGQARYQLHLKPNRHLVRNCKFFEKDGAGEWNVVFRDEWIDWESDDDIFRHQITFTQMDALFAEAEHSNLSVRDAVQDFMKRFAQHDPWHVHDIHEHVFRWMRTCSLAAVWAQFRPEHECYERDERAGASRYIFNPTGAFPRVRLFPRAEQDEQHAIRHDENGHADPTRVRIVVHWSRILSETCPDEEFKGDSSGVLYAQFLGSLLAKRPAFTESLTRINVSRFPLSIAPDTCFMNPEKNRPYPKRPVPGTQPQLYLCTQGGADEIRRHILSLAERLHFPQGSIKVFITPHMTAQMARAAFLASI